MHLYDVQLSSGAKPIPKHAQHAFSVDPFVFCFSRNKIMFAFSNFHFFLTPRRAPKPRNRARIREPMFRNWPQTSQRAQLDRNNWPKRSPFRVLGGAKRPVLATHPVRCQRRVMPGRPGGQGAAQKNTYPQWNQGLRWMRTHSSEVISHNPVRLRQNGGKAARKELGETTVALRGPPTPFMVRRELGETMVGDHQPRTWCAENSVKRWWETTKPVHGETTVALRGPPTPYMVRRELGETMVGDHQPRTR